jgi:hypothetical protein
MLFGMYYRVNGVARRANCEHIVDSSYHLTGISLPTGLLARYLRSCSTSFFYSQCFIQTLIISVIKVYDAFHPVPKGKLCFYIIALVQIILTCLIGGF